jgi:hypothetical protein
MKIIDIIAIGKLVFIEQLVSEKYGLYSSEPKQKLLKHKSNIIL